MSSRWWSEFLSRLARTAPLLLVTGLAVVGIRSPALAAEHVCLEDGKAAMRRYYQWTDEEVQEMARVRGMRLDPLSPTVGMDIENYLARLPNSALIAYGVDDDAICAFMWRWDRSWRAFYYARQPYSPGTLEKLSHRLSSVLQVTTAQTLRAGKKIGSDRSAPAAIPPNMSGTDQSIVGKLSELFFPTTLRPHLEGIEHVSFVPVRNMSSIPVGMLTPLGDGRQVVDLFSYSFLAFLKDVSDGVDLQATKVESVLSIGNPRPSIDSQWTWIPLAGAEDEARQSYRAFGGTLLVREQATKSAVLSHLAEASLIHFASHGFTDVRDALDGSFLVLADGRLTAREIQDLKLKPNHPIVVLSACHTGEGFAMNAGVVGLARGFQKAGASSTVMSLWAVDDAATVELMTSFFDKINTLRPSEALRRSMLRLLASAPRPAYWAAFNVYGLH